MSWCDCEKNIANTLQGTNNMSDTMKSWDLFEGFPRYQRAVTRTMKVQGKRDAVIEGAFGLAGEAGEVVDRIKKYLYQGHTENIKADLVEELGDVLWYLTDICTLFDIELSQVAAFNIAKLLDRYPTGFDEAASRARVDLREDGGQIGGVVRDDYRRMVAFVPTVQEGEDALRRAAVRMCKCATSQELDEEHNIEPGVIHKGYGTDTL